MSFRCLLFCPDEKAALVVSQVLNELDFTVENVTESFAAVQRLTAEHFHALVVDCQNEQDASLLFKAARNSAQNSGSLSVAVVEGQAGVAKAFRIGANLVLTKPINVEQSKSTLRVARGLLKKTQGAATAAPASMTAATAPQSFDPVTPKPKPIPEPAMPAKAASAESPLFMPAVKSPAAVPVPAASVPFSGLVLESDPEPVTEASDAALLESLPQIGERRVAESPAPALLSHAQPIAATTSGQAAAAARAPEAKPIEFRTAGAAPMVTNEPIVPASFPVPEPEMAGSEPVAAPSFSSLETSGGSGTGWLLKIAVVIVVLAAGGYFGWKQPAVRQYADRLLHRTEAVAPEAPATTADSEVEAPAAQKPIQEAPSPSETHTARGVAPAGTADISDSSTTAQSNGNHTRAGATETIEVQEMPLARESTKVTVTPKPEPIVVKNGPAVEKAATQPAPPSVDAVAIKSDAAFPALAPESFALPKAAPGTIRISQGVSQGLLVKKVQPVYPSFARQLHRDGTVQLLATIDKNGSVKKTQVLSGDVVLARAATDAVKQWQYRPYLLNGQPVEIETQITVLFKGQ